MPPRRLPQPMKPLDQFPAIRHPRKRHPLNPPQIRPQLAFHGWDFIYWRSAASIPRPTPPSFQWPHPQCLSEGTAPVSVAPLRKQSATASGKPEPRRRRRRVAELSNRERSYGQDAATACQRLLKTQSFVQLLAGGAWAAEGGTAN